MLVAHRLNSGEWLLTLFDGANLATLVGDVAERVLQALRRLQGSP